MIMVNTFCIRPLRRPNICTQASLGNGISMRHLLTGCISKSGKDLLCLMWCFPVSNILTKQRLDAARKQSSECVTELQQSTPFASASAVFRALHKPSREPKQPSIRGYVKKNLTTRQHGDVKRKKDPEPEIFRTASLQLSCN